MSLRPLMFFKPLAFFENPARGGLHLDGGPSEDITPRADLFSGGVGEKKIVTEWVKNGETTAEAKALADSLHAQMEAIKRETNLQLVQEYRFVFDKNVLSPESYDSNPTSVDTTYKNKGALYVLEKSCPILAAQFKAYPDLRYLAYANATKQVPDVDVLPMGSTLSMVDGRVLLQRPGKPDASFMIFPWDYRAEIEKKYQELKPAPLPAPDDVDEVLKESAQREAEAQALQEQGETFRREADEDVFEMETEKDDGTEVEPELQQEGRDANLRTEWEEDVKPALMALEQTYPGVTVRIRDASFVPAKDKPKGEVDRWPNYGKHGKTVELVGEDGRTERFQILVPRKAESYFDDKVNLTHDKDPNMGVTWENVQNGAGLTEYFVQEAEKLFAEEKLSALLPTDIQALSELPADRQIHYLSDLVLQNVELVTQESKTWTEQDRRALSQLYNGGLLENMMTWHQELSARTDLTPAMKDNLRSIGTHLTFFTSHRPTTTTPEAPARKEKEKVPEFTATQQYGFYTEAVRAGNIGLAREFLVKARKADKDGTLTSEQNVETALEAIDQNYGRVRFELQAGQSVVAEGTPSTASTQALSYLSGALASDQGKVEVLLPVGPYKVVDSSGATVKTFRISTGRNPVID